MNRPLRRIQTQDKTQRLRSMITAKAIKQQMMVYVPPHPLVKHWVAIARNAATPPSMFRGALSELGRILLYEASRNFLRTIDATVCTPLSETDVTFVDPSQPIKVIPILRSGLVLYEHAASILPVMETYHVGIKQDEETAKRSLYLNTLPEGFSSNDQIVVMDGNMATSESVMLVVDEIVSHGAEAKNICLICAVTAPPALKVLSEKYPELKMYAGIIDSEVNAHGLAIPGFGNEEIRSYGAISNI